MPPDIEITKVEQVAPAPDRAALVVKAEALLGDNSTEVEIAITTDLAQRGHRAARDNCQSACGAGRVAARIGAAGCRCRRIRQCREGPAASLV